MGDRIWQEERIVKREENQEQALCDWCSEAGRVDKLKGDRGGVMRKMEEQP